MLTVDIEELTARVASGAALTSSELRELAQSRDLIGLGMLAADVRARLLGARATFVRVDTVSVEDVAAGVEIAADAGEVRFAGPVGTLDAALSAIATVRAATTLPITGWALHDLVTLGSIDQILPALRTAGLDAVATARLDRLDLEQLQAVKASGLAIQVVTLGTPLDGDALLDALEQLRAWQAATGVVRACAPLPVEVPAEAATTGFDDMRHVALARLVLDNVTHLSAHWTRMGAKLSQSCLLFGADDIDAVPARDDMPHGPRRAIVEEVRRNISAASLEVVERDGAWQPRGAA